MALPGAPTGLVADSVGVFFITVSWTAPADDGGLPINWYEVEYSADAGVTWEWAGIPDGLQITVNGLTSDTSYQFRVSAENADGLGPWSDTLTVSTLAGVEPPPGGDPPPPPPSNPFPSTPTGLTAYGSTGDANTFISWDASTPGGEYPIDGYDIRRSSDAGATWVYSFNEPGFFTISGTTAQLTGLASFTAYLIQIRAYDTGGVSDWSDSLTYDTEYWQTGGVFAPPSGPNYPPVGYTDIPGASRLNELAGTAGESATTAANIWAGTTGESLTTALNIVAGTTGESATTALNIIAGTTGEPAAEAARKIGSNNVNPG